ncbi:UNVERIFIED_CONTAM: ymcC [Trichonephila clavipes]
MALNLKEVDGVPIKAKHKATCHCGSVEFELDLPDGLVELRRCDCSLCRRRGAIAASIPLSAYDLRSGTTAEFAHGLAAAYLGFTLVFGRSVIEWADSYFAYKYNGQEKPNKKYGWAYAKYEWMQWIKGVAACVIACILLYLAIIYVNNDTKTEALAEWMYILPSLMFFWLLFGPLWYTVFQKNKPRTVSE